MLVQRYEGTLRLTSDDFVYIKKALVEVDMRTKERMMLVQRYDGILRLTGDEFVLRNGEVDKRMRMMLVQRYDGSLRLVTCDEFVLRKGDTWRA